MEESIEEELTRDELFKKAVEESFKQYESVFRALAKRDTEPHYSDYSLLRQREGMETAKEK